MLVDWCLPSKETRGGGNRVHNRSGKGDAQDDCRSCTWREGGAHVTQRHAKGYPSVH
jgi:hypothetical protein